VIQIKKELKRFLVAGFGAVSTDLATYYILLNFLNTDIAKGISFLLGTIVAFVINKYWTFEKTEKSYQQIVQFSVLYTLTLGVNVVINKFILDIFGTTLLAFLIATGVSTVLNFIGQKWWVFR
jgi:putative flippase GtrA